MKPYKSIYSEGEKLKILPDSRVSTGSSLVMTFDEDQNQIMHDIVYQTNNRLLQTFIGEDDKKYGTTLLIIYGPLYFTLYTYYGDFRIGGGSQLSSKSLLLNYLNLDNFLKDLNKI
jgi:hypothetical protein